jgi:hypothetical protein
MSEAISIKHTWPTIPRRFPGAGSVRHLGMVWSEHVEFADDALALERSRDDSVDDPARNAQLSP